MARRSRRKRNGIGWAGWGGIALICFAVACVGGLTAFYNLTPKAPELDPKSLCPVAGADGVTVILVDATDDLPEIGKKEVFGILDDLITSLPPFYKLDIRVLEIGAQSSRSLFSKCNPGDGTGLSEWTSNPQVARARWLENFRKPAREAVNNSLGAAKADKSPIMAALQDIAVDQFSSAAAQRAQKKLIVISDMLEFTLDYSQYPRAGDLSYERFRRSSAYLKFRTDLHGAEMRIEYVQRRALPPRFDTAQHMEFWRQWTADNGGGRFSAHRLQGVN